RVDRAGNVSAEFIGGPSAHVDDHEPGLPQIFLQGVSLDEERMCHVHSLRMMSVQCSMFNHRRTLDNCSHLVEDSSLAVGNRFEPRRPSNLHSTEIPARIPRTGKDQCPSDRTWFEAPHVAYPSECGTAHVS